MAIQNGQITRLQVEKLFTDFTKSFGTEISNKIDGILPFDIPGIGLIVLFALITLIGMLGAKLIASPFNSLFNKVLEILNDDF